MRRLLYALTIVTVAVSAAACGADSFGVAGPQEPATIEDVFGQYTATVLTVDGEDLLALGTTLFLRMNRDLTVTGEFDVPEAAGGPLEADMAGTFTFTDGVVDITQDADTFVRDVEWNVPAPYVLAGEYASSEGLVVVRLLGLPIP